MRPYAALITPDVHVPWHNKTLLRKICRLSIHEKIDELDIPGDFSDMNSLNSHQRGSLLKLKTTTLTEEYKQGNELLDGLCASVGKKAKKRFIYGNHEARYFGWLEDGDNAKVGEELTSPEEGLRLRERGFDVQTNWKDDSVKLGKYLELCHGNKTGKHTAAAALEDFEGSVIFGHSHRFQIYVTGKRAAYNIGFLGDKDSGGFNYMAASGRRKWVNGFAMVYILDDGSYRVVPVQCYNDSFVFNGRVY